MTEAERQRTEDTVRAWSDRKLAAELRRRRPEKYGRVRVPELFDQPETKEKKGRMT